MNHQLVNTARISISNFTFDSKTNTISFFSTKTNKCWNIAVNKPLYDFLEINNKNNPTQSNLNYLKKLCKNGN